jgi:spore coat polysaccharide biosynthesis protein SpsF
MSKEGERTEAERLEQLWGGAFGDAYVDRNREATQHRAGFWRAIKTEFPARRVLEVGCNLGANLTWLAEGAAPGDVYGVDVNQKALSVLHANLPSVNAVLAPARQLPFRDRWFDLTFTMGVLIHQPPDQLPLVMSEIVRCSSRWVLCGEYFAETPTEIPYRNETRALFKRDFGGMYHELFPELTLRKQGFLSRADGWDDVTYWVFERT